MIEQPHQPQWRQQSFGQSEFARLRIHFQASGITPEGILRIKFRIYQDRFVANFFNHTQHQDLRWLNIPVWDDYYCKPDLGTCTKLLE